MSLAQEIVQMTGAIEDEIAALDRGGHACLLSAADDDLRRAMAAFLREGLRRGERCVYAGPAGDQSAVLALLSATGMPVARLRQRRALVLEDVEGLYTTRGRFDPVAQGNRVSGEIEEARRDGFNGFRAVAQHDPRVARAVSPAELARYEAGLTEIAREKSASVLCVYDRRSIAGPLVDEALRTHATVVIGGRLCANPFCDPAAYTLGAVGPERRVDWMATQILRTDDSARLLRAMNDALIREATSLAVQNIAGRDRQQDLVEAIETRDMLIGMLNRQLRGPLASLRDTLDRVLGDAALGPARLLVEGGREDLEAILALAARLDEAAATVGMKVDLRPEASDLVEIARNAVERWHAEPGRSEVEVSLGGAGAVPGRWDRLRLTQVVTHLLGIACDQSWGTPLEMRVEEVGPRARITVRYHAVEHDPAAGAAGLAPRHRMPVSDYDQLGLALWPARELVRLMGGTVGVSSWADARIRITVDLPRAGNEGSGEPAPPG